MLLKVMKAETFEFLSKFSGIDEFDIGTYKWSKDAR